MSIKDLHNKRVAVLGFGQEGQAVSRYLSNHNINCVVFDEKPYENWDENIRILIENQLGITTITGLGYLDKLTTFDYIFRSPGFWRKHPVLLAAETAAAKITSQTKWFMEHTPAITIGVTGTKGKGTTCSLIYEIIKRAQVSRHSSIVNAQLYLTGNIGKVQPLDFLDTLHTDDVVVYELSSFQLQDLETSPDYSVCLMVTSDHLNHHQTLHEYHEAKSTIAKYQTKHQSIVYNSDYLAANLIGKQGNGIKYQVTKQALDPMMQGALIDEKQNCITIQGQMLTSMVIDCSQRKLRGNHNLENIAAASLVAAQLGIEANIIEPTVKEFPGLEHRLQFVGTVQSVSYYNDSISTVPDTTIAAIHSFIEPVILIVGGSNKGIPYEHMVNDIIAQSNIKAVAIMGETGIIIDQLLQNKRFSKPIIGHANSSFAEILTAITALAEPGDAVLLSPASASFDMFKNYADRGNQFVAYVNSLSNPAQ